MDIESRDILEKNLYKLKGVTGLLESMALADYSGTPLEMQDTYSLLADLVREIYKDLEPLVDISVS